MKPATKATEETILIGSVKFTKQAPPDIRGSARCVLSTNAKGRAELRFNALQLTTMPGFTTAEHIALFLAGATTPNLALFPASEGMKVKQDTSGAYKLSGSPLRALAVKYRRITYRVEPIESPRKGWLLTAVESERLTAA
jgi:hypothetical protein